MNVLVIGAGLTGVYFAKEMMQRGHSVALFDIAPNADYVTSVAGKVGLIRGDVRDLPAVVEAMKSNKVDTIFLNAGFIGGKAEERPFTTISVNLGGAVNVCEACQLTGVRRLVFASTFGVYDWDLNPTAPVKEDYPQGGNMFYHACKTSCERILTAYSSKYGFELALLRFARVYGRGMYAGGSGGGQAMHAAVASAIRGGPVHINPKVLGISEYVYVKDLAMGVALACEKSLKSRAFNIGTGVMIRPQDIANALKAACPGVEAVVDGEAVPHHGEQPLDLSRSREELGYAPKFNIERGMRDFAEELRRVQI